MRKEKKLLKYKPPHKKMNIVTNLNRKIKE
jgi:hypothetical protein